MNEGMNENTFFYRTTTVAVSGITYFPLPYTQLDFNGPGFFDLFDIRPRIIKAKILKSSNISHFASEFDNSP